MNININDKKALHENYVMINKEDQIANKNWLGNIAQTKPQINSSTWSGTFNYVSTNRIAEIKLENTEVDRSVLMQLINIATQSNITLSLKGISIKEDVKESEDRDIDINDCSGLSEDKLFEIAKQQTIANLKQSEEIKEDPLEHMIVSEIGDTINHSKTIQQEEPILEETFKQKAEREVQELKLKLEASQQTIKYLKDFYQTHILDIKAQFNLRLKEALTEASESLRQDPLDDIMNETPTEL